MTENDPSAQNDADARRDPARPEQASWSQDTPVAGDANATAQGADPGEQGASGSAGASQSGPGAPSPWSAHGQPAQQYAQATPGQPATGQVPAGYGTYGQPAPGQSAAGSAAESQQMGALYGGAPQQGGGTQGPYYGYPGMSYPTPPQPQRKRGNGSGGPGKLVAGAAVVALLVGGVAGGVGGYLVSDAGPGSSVSSLESSPPAKQTSAAPEGTVESVAQKVSPSVVQLQVQSRAGSGSGSGFVISSDGYVLTNNHVVEAAANGDGQIQAAFPDGRKGAAEVIGRDPTTDIAVVKVAGVDNLTPVELGRSDDLRVGQSVVAIGSPFELSGTVTAGIVSALHRPVQAGSSADQATVMDAVQTDAAINPGNSGGPLTNMAGQVIGINSVIYSPGSGSGAQGQQGEAGNVGIGFAIPIDQARRTADEIIKTGKATQTFLGAQVGNGPQGGAVLGAITPDSPADKAGLKSGDVVTKMDDRSIDSADALVAAVRTRAPNEKVTLTVGDSRTVDVTLGGQPIEPK